MVARMNSMSTVSTNSDESITFHGPIFPYVHDSQYTEVANQMPIYHTPYTLHQHFSALSPYAVNQPTGHPLLVLPKVLLDAFHEYELRRFIAALTTQATPSCQVKVQDRMYALRDQQDCWDVLRDLFTKCPDAVLRLLNKPKYVLVKRAAVAAGANTDTHIGDGEVYSPVTHYRAIQCNFVFKSVLIPQTIQQFATSSQPQHQGQIYVEVEVEGSCLFFLHNSAPPPLLLTASDSADIKPNHLSILDLYQDLIDGVEILWTLSSVNTFQLPTE